MAQDAHRLMTILHFISGRFITLCWGAFILVLVVSAFSVKPTIERQSWTGRLATFAFLTLAFMLLLEKISWWGITTRIWPTGRALRILACIITLGGLAVSIWSRLSLGPNWSATVTYREGHELVARGPYRFARHPMYAGFLLMVSGTVINLGDISGLAALTLCGLGTWWKLRQEEALLKKHFPDTYPDYKSRTKALIPFVF
jgi:protein-S-isoprenylcysteine O-methyltransferase Ste14